MNKVAPVNGASEMTKSPPAALQACKSLQLRNSTSEGARVMFVVTPAPLMKTVTTKLWLFLMSTLARKRRELHWELGALESSMYSPHTQLDAEGVVDGPMETALIHVPHSEPPSAR